MCTEDHSDQAFERIRRLLRLVLWWHCRRGRRADLGGRWIVVGDDVVKSGDRRRGCKDWSEYHERSLRAQGYTPGLYAFCDASNMFVTMSRLSAGPSSGGAGASVFSPAEPLLRSARSFSSSFSSAAFQVPRGPLALPRYASASPFVTIPRTPVPLILSASLIPCSCSRRSTLGKSGRELEGSPCEGRCAGTEGGAPDLSELVEGEAEVEVGSGLGEDSAFGCEGWESSCGTSRLEMSSPSSASKAMVLPTGMFFVPSAA